MEVDGVSREGETVKDSKLDSNGESDKLSVKGKLQYQKVCLPKQNAEATELKCAKAVNGADNSPLFYAERSDLCRWNDSDYIESYRRSLGQAVEAVRNGDLEGEEEEESESEDESSGSEMEEDLANCLVLDMTHGLSPFGLIAAREGMLYELFTKPFAVVYSHGFYKFLSCCIFSLGADFVQIGRTHEIYKSLMEQLAESNKLADHVSFRYLDLTGTSHSQVVWDIVVCDMINPQGELRAGILEELAFIR